MKRLPVLAGLAVMVAAAGSLLVPGAATAASPTPQSFMYKTKIQFVHVRSAPKPTAGSKVTSIIQHTGTVVKVSCYVSAAGKVWFKIVAPAGFVAARNLDMKRPHGVKVPAGLPVCV